MALAIYRSNRLDVLVTVLAELLRQPGQQPGDPFTPVRVVVGTRGMERWLRHQLAVKLGICAHFEFPFPRQLVDTLLGSAEGAEAPPDDPWRAGALTWRVLESLEALPRGDVWGPLRAYVGESGRPVDPRRHALARELGDLVDRYVTYRPELARAWSAGEPAPASLLPRSPGSADRRALPETLAWQPELWRDLAARLDGSKHTAERLLEAGRVFEAGPRPELDQPVRLFGLSTLPPAWLQLLASVARHHRVELYLPCPSDRWWGDLRRGQGPARDLLRLDRDEVSLALSGDTEGLFAEGNPLLTSLGRIARDLQVVLESLDDSYVDERLDLFPDVGQVFDDPARGGGVSALHRIQSDVLDLRNPALQPDRPLAAADDSLQVHACYGPTRQVEALREALLGLFETHRDLEPRDVVVMTPDIAGYAPLITAVFDQGAHGRRVRDREPVWGSEGWGPAGAPRLPYEIADLSVRRLNPVADALLRVLELASARVTASAVLDLARLEPVRTRFELTAEELERLGDMVREAGARWGLDAADRRFHDQPADPQNTWVDALDRLWLGVAMPDTGELYEGLVPADGVEGSDVDLLGRFGDLAGVVLGAVRDLRQPRTVAAWVVRLRALVSDLTATPGQAAWLTRRALEALEGVADEAGTCELEVSVRAMGAALSGRFDVAAGGLRPQTGAITFCALAPERSLPYRVVCLLGMDEDAFPRKSSHSAFDLMNLAPRVGDRDGRDEDRLLLLEAILAARDHLLVFYSGRDVRSDEPLPPCVPVAEFFDTLDATFGEDARGRSATTQLIVQHPLQPFSPRVFTRKGEAPWHRRAFGFDRRLLAGAGVEPQAASGPFFVGLDGDPPETDPEVVELGELLDFVDHPTRSFFRQVLGVTVWDGVQAVDDREPVAVDDRAVPRALLEAALSAPSAGWVPDYLDAAFARLRGEGRLPLGDAGLYGAFPHRLVAAGMREAAAPWHTAEEDHADLDLDLGDGLRLSGRVHGLQAGDLFELLPFKDTSARPWWLVRPLVRLLAWQAATPGERCRVVALHGFADGDRPKVQWRLLEPPEHVEDASEDARQRLRRLVELMRRARRRPPPLYGATSDAFAKALVAAEGLDPDVLLAAGTWPPADPEDLAAVQAATRAAFDAWVGGARTGEWAQSAYLKRLHTDGELTWIEPDTGQVDRAFADAALALWGTLRQWRRTLRKAPTVLGETP